MGACIPGILELVEDDFCGSFEGEALDCVPVIEKLKKEKNTSCINFYFLFE